MNEEDNRLDHSFLSLLALHESMEQDMRKRKKGEEKTIVCKVIGLIEMKEILFFLLILFFLRFYNQKIHAKKAEITCLFVPLLSCLYHPQTFDDHSHNSDPALACVCMYS